MDQSQSDLPDWVTLADDETVLWSGIPSLYTVVGGIVSGIVLAAIGIGLTLAVVVTPAWVPDVLTDVLTAQPRWVQWTPLILVAVGLLYAIGTILLRRTTQYVITSEEVYRKDGLLRKNVATIRHTHIQDTACDQSVLERLFSFGDIAIDTAGGDGIELSLTGIPDPQTVNGYLNQALDNTTTQTQTARV